MDIVKETTKEENLVNLDEVATKSRKYIFLTMATLGLVVITSLMNMGDSYECRHLNNADACAEYRHYINCRTTAATPLRLYMHSVVSSGEVIYEAQCAWDAALSEVRVSFVVIALILGYLGLRAIKEEDIAKANIFIYGGIFAAVLLLLAAFFDSVEIMDSLNDNDNLCSLKGEFAVSHKIQIQEYYCTYWHFYLSVGLTVLSAIIQLLASFSLINWIKEIQGIPIF